MTVPSTLIPSQTTVYQRIANIITTKCALSQVFLTTFFFLKSYDKLQVIFNLLTHGRNKGKVSCTPISRTQKRPKLLQSRFMTDRHFISKKLMSVPNSLIPPHARCIANASDVFRCKHARDRLTNRQTEFKVDLVLDFAKITLL